MALLNYREIAERFWHIDADFVAAHVDLPGDGVYQVRFYPWWEHPLVQEAAAANKPWYIQRPEDSQITVTVYARQVNHAHLSQRAEVVEWQFLDDHPLLWRYANEGQIVCNSPLTNDQLIDLIDLVRNRLGQWGSFDHFLNVPRSLQTFRAWAMSPPFSLGTFPIPLLHDVANHLDAIGAQYYVPRPPQVRTTQPKLLLIDDEDYIIAQDFEVDVPPIFHRPEWFLPNESSVTTEQ